MLDEHVPTGVTVTHDLRIADILTPRELEIATYIASGRGRLEIAQILHISPKTYDTHRGELLRKLGARNSVELALRAVREGLVNA